MWLRLVIRVGEYLSSVEREGPEGERGAGGGGQNSMEVPKIREKNTAKGSTCLV